jgi:hypothetical protein
MWKVPTVRFSIRGLLIVTAAVAGLLGLPRWLDQYGGLAVAIPIALILFSIVLDRICSESSDSSAPSTSGPLVGRHLAALAGAGLASVAAWKGMRNGNPELMSPLPFLAVLPVLFGGPLIVSLATPFVAFLTLAYVPPTAGRSLPLRFPILLALATALSIAWFAYAVQYSYGYHGPRYTIGITIINAVMILGLWTAWLIIRRRAVWWTALTWSAALCYWLFGFAFPWLGELP